MKALARLAPVLGLNSVPIVGVFAAGWTSSTAVALYWLENLLLIGFHSARIVLHRRWTRKRGHWDVPMTVTRSRGGKTTTEHRRTTFLTSFLVTTIPFTLAHGLFLALVLFLVVPEKAPAAGTVDLLALGRGAFGLFAFGGLGLGLDLVDLERRPFAWVESLLERSMGRVILIHLTIILGMLGIAFFEAPIGFFGVFAGFKTLADLASLLPRREAPKEAPGCLTSGWLAQNLRTPDGKDFATHWREQQEKERLEAARKEEILS